MLCARERFAGCGRGVATSVEYSLHGRTHAHDAKETCLDHEAKETCLGQRTCVKQKH